MRETDGQDPEQRPRERRTQHARHLGGGLDPVAQRVGEEDRPHQHHRDRTGHQPEHQKGWKLDIEGHPALHRQGEFGDAAELDPVDDRTGDAGDGDGREGVHGEVPKHHLEREQRAGNRRVEARRDRTGDGAAEQIAPGDPVGPDPARDPGGDHRGEVHHRPLAARGAAGRERDQRGERRAETGAPFDPPVAQGRRLDHVRHRAHPPVRREPVEDHADHEATDHRQQHHPVPRQRAGMGVQVRDVGGAVEHRLQPLDAEPEQERGKPGADPDHQRDEPELHLVRAPRDHPRPGRGKLLALRRHGSGQEIGQKLAHRAPVSC